MMLWQRGRQAQKTKQPPSQSRDEGCAAQNSVVPPKLQRINCPLPLSARYRCAASGLHSPEAPGWREMDPTGTPCSLRAFSLDGGVYISGPIIAICHNFTSHKTGTQPPCVQLNYSIRKTFVNGFEQNLRHPDAVCTGYLAVLDGHGRVSCIPPISIFFIAHCITNRPISLYDHWVGFKVCCTVR